MELDVVELRVAVGRWPAGTRATLVETFPDGGVLEFADDEGRSLDFASVPYSAVRSTDVPKQERLAI